MNDNSFKKEVQMKRGYIFTLDAFIATIVIVAGIFIIFSTTSAETPKTNLFLISEDTLDFLSSTNIYEINDEFYPFLKELKTNNNITDFSNTLMEQIGEFYVMGKINLASNFARNMTHNIVPVQFNYQVLVNNTNIYNTSSTQETSVTLISSKTIISGLLNKTYMWGPLDAEVRIWQ